MSRRLITRICELPECGKEFQTFKSEVRRGYGRFCSRACGTIHRGREKTKKDLAGRHRECLECKTEFFTKISSDPNKFCSHSCSAKHNNRKRPPKSEETKKKISTALKKRAKENPEVFKNENKVIGVGHTPLDSHYNRIIENTCENCGKFFLYYRKRRFCSEECYFWLNGKMPPLPQSGDYSKIYYLNCVTCNFEFISDGKQKTCNSCPETTTTKKPRKHIQGKYRKIHYRNCVHCGLLFIHPKKDGRKTCSEKCYKERQSQNAAKQEVWSKRHKQGWYRDIWCASSYELAFLIWNLDQNKEIRRCETTFKYYHKGKEKLYIPDFQIGQEIHEMKGYHDDTVYLKIAAVEYSGKQITL